MILVIGSDASLVDRLVDGLNGEGGSVIASATMDSGLPLLRAAEIALVVCDVPGDGLAAIEPCRPLVEVAAARSVPLLVITGWRDLMFERGHFLACAPGRRTVVFRPLADSLWIEEARRLLEGCGERCHA